MQIDIFSAEINNKNNVIETGFGLSVYIVPSFQKFKNNSFFSLKEKQNEKYNQIKYFPESLHNHLIVVNEYTVNFNKIENIIAYSLIYEDLTTCNNCKFGDNTSTCRIFYNIISYPNYLFIYFI